MKHLSLMIATGALATACQGGTFPQPPIHLNQNMDFQKRIEPQEENPYTGTMGNRKPVEGTVRMGGLTIDDHLHRGKIDGELVEELPDVDEKGMPIEMNEAFLARGQERYNVYCQPCHAQTGSGKGLVSVNSGGNIQPPALYNERLLTMPIGHFYNVITNGVNGNMPPYRAQIPVGDRWAIAAYVRVLQRAAFADVGAVPGDVAKEKGWN
ncbi:MAG: c-type cytochrome [Myxococcota bacterium]